MLTSTAPLSAQTPVRVPTRGSAGKVVLLLLGVAVMAGVAAVVWKVQAGKIHYAHMERIGRWVQDARESPPAGVDRQVWNDWMGMTYTGVVNLMQRPKYAATAKVKALADELDANKGQDLKSVEGLLHLLDRIGEASPMAADYQLYAQLRQDIAERFPHVRPR